MKREATENPSWTTLRQDRLFWLMLALHVSVSLFLSWKVGIWVDEYFSLDTSGSGLARAWQQSIHFELQPPAYFLLLSLWLQIDDSAFFGRLFSLLWSVSTLFAMRGLSRRWLPQIDANWVVACVALNPYLVWASAELRLYSFAVFLAALLLLLFHDGFFEGEGDTRKSWAYALLAGLTLYTQYYLGFLLVAHAAALLATGRLRALVRYCALMVVSALLFAPMVPTVLMQVSEHADSLLQKPGLLLSLWAIFHHAQEMAFPLYKVVSWYWVALMAGLLVAGATVLFFGRRRIGEHLIAILSALAVAIVFFVVTIYHSGPEVVNRSHAGGLFVLSCLLPLVLIATLEGRARQIVLATWTASIVLLSVVMNYQVHAPLQKHAASQKTAEYIQEREREGQAILIFPGKMALPFSYHYRGVNPVLPLPRPSDLSTANLHADVLSSEREIADALATLPEQPERIWVISTMRPEQDEYLGVKYNTRFLLNYLQKNYGMTSQRAFIGAEVLYLRRKDARRD